MLKTKIVAVSALAVALSMTSLTANAAKPGWSIGVNANYNIIKNASSSKTGSVFGTNYKSSPVYTNKEGAGIEALAEYNFNNWFGLGASIGYSSGFESAYSVQQNSGSSKLSHRKFSLGNLSAYTRLAYTFDDKGSDVYLKAGLAVIHAKYKKDNNFDQSKTSFAPVIGIGAQYYLTEHLAVRSGIDYTFKGVQGKDSYATSTNGVRSNAHMGKLKGDLIKLNLGMIYSF